METPSILEVLSNILKNTWQILFEFKQIEKNIFTDIIFKLNVVMKANRGEITAVYCSFPSCLFDKRFLGNHEDKHFL